MSIVLDRGGVFCAAILLCLLVIFVFKQRNSKHYNYLFTMLLIMGIIFTIFDSYAYSCVNSASEPLRAKGCFVYKEAIFSCLLFLTYSCFYIVKKIKIENFVTYHVGATVAFVISLFVLIKSPVNIQRTDNGNFYVSFISAYMYCGFLVFYILMLFVLIKYKRNIPDSYFLSYNLSLIFVVVLKIIEHSNHLIFTNNICVTMFCMIAYLTIEDPNIELSNEVQKAIKIEREINKEKTLFISQVSHELRTPLNVISGMIDLISDTELTSEQIGFFDNIKTASESLLFSVNDILDFNKLGSNKLSLIPEIYDLTKLIHEIEAMGIARIDTKPIKFKTEFLSGFNNNYYLKGDKNRLKQILLNLVNNAIKFTENGEIKLKVWEVGHEGNLLLYCEVSDTGQGIKKEDLNKLFKPFAQVDKVRNKNKEGTGLGLSVCKELINMQGGDIEVSSKYNIGSTFRFFIRQDVPTTEEIEAFIYKSKKKSEVFNIKCDGMEVLVIDDNDLNLEVAKSLMKKFGVTVTSANSGQSALRIIEEKRNFFDIVFVDRMMPEMSGEETVKRILDIYNGEAPFPIYALSADITKEAVETMSNAGCVGFLEKPIKLKELKSILKVHFKDKNIIEAEDKEIESVDSCEKYKEILNLNDALFYCGDNVTLAKAIKIFYSSFNNKKDVILKHLENDDITNFTVEVHAMKTTTRTIGREDLGKAYERLELFGKKETTTTLSDVYKETIDLLEITGVISAELQRLDLNSNSLHDISADELKSLIEKLYEASESFNLDKMDNIYAQIASYKIPNEYQDICKSIENAILDIDNSEVSKLCKSFLKIA